MAMLLAFLLLLLGNAKAFVILPHSAQGHSCRLAVEQPMTSVQAAEGDVREHLRNAIYHVSDALTEVAEPLINRDTTSVGPFEQLGQVLMEFEETMFKSATSVTGQYLNSLSGKAPIKVEEPSTSNAAKVTLIEPIEKTPDSPTTVPIMEAEPTLAGGVTNLQRPEKVQSVFDELQQAAVSTYNEVFSPATKKVIEEEVLPVIVAPKMLEEELETLLKGCTFAPSSLPDSEKEQMVAAIEKLEEVYPATAQPFTDPTLAGTYSMVYSSKGSVFKALLGNKRSKFFKTSDHTQTIDLDNKTVTNTCKIRLRLTPLTFTLNQVGTFAESPDKKTADVDFKRGRLGKFLSIFRKGKVNASVTYLSDSWRICKSGDVTLAFRKVTETK